MAAGGGSGAVGITEGEARHEVDRTYGVQRFLKLLFRFAGKTDDEVRGQGNVGAGGTEAFHKRHVAGHVVLAVHAGQHAIRSGLERQVQARAEVRNFPEHGDDLWGEIDLKTATREGRNIMTEKYARMMESTFPEEYRKLAASLPPVDKETLQKIEEIVAINVGWKAELFDRYPRLSGKGRPLRTSEDSAMETSFETYLRGELKTYSARTITLLHELTLRQQQDGVNGAALNLLNQVQQYGYATLEQAEGHRAGA